jgi:hypothetical protein
MMRTEDNNQSAEKWLDTALKQYGEAEPRPGLENRVLANLDAQRAQLTLRPWWWRPTAAVVAVAVLAAAGLLLRRHPEVTVKSKTANQATIAGETTEPEPPIEPAVRPRTPPGSRVRSQIRSQRALSVPRLEQFPAPAPLSEQEKILAQYVRDHRWEATMVARARAELLKQELEQFMKTSPSEQPRDLEQ